MEHEKIYISAFTIENVICEAISSLCKDIVTGAVEYDSRANSIKTLVDAYCVIHHETKGE